MSTKKDKKSLFQKIKDTINSNISIILIVLSIVGVISQLDMGNINVNIKEVHYQMIFNVIRALILIIPSIITIKNLKNKYSGINNFQDLENELYKRDKLKEIFDIIQGIIYIFMTVKLYYFYHPKYMERSLAILIKNLKEQNLINPEVYKQLKSLRPHNIKKFV